MSTVIKKPIKFKTKKRRKKDIWVKNVLTRKILLPFQSVGNNIRENIQLKLEKNLYDKCS